MAQARYFLIPLFILILAPFVHAQSSAQLQAELNALLQQLATLQSQLQTSGAPGTVPVVTGAYGQCPTLTRALRMGMSGSDVTALQAFLAADSRIYPEGTVSGYFGGLTQAAVQRFQARHGIVTSGTPDTTGYGAVGPATRAAIAGVCGGTAGGGGVIVPPVIPPPPQPVGANCIFSGMNLASGATVQMYSAPAAPPGGSCASYTQTRQCMNGVMTGNAAYQYTTCTDTIGQPCFVNGTSIPHGSSRTFYLQNTVPYGSVCGSQSQQRTCSNGVMSGSPSYQYHACSAAAANSCVVDSTTVSHNSSQTFYINNLIAFGGSCTANSNSQSRTCTNGTLSGSSTYSKPSCAVASSSSCTLDGLTVSNGSNKDFYNTRTVSFISGVTTCPLANKLSRKCTNGILEGSGDYQYAACTVSPASSCTLDGQTVPHNSTYTFHSASSVAYGTTCASVSQLRKCINGAFNGSDTYNKASCTVGAGSVCSTSDNYTIPHGSSTPMYTASSVSFGSTCAKVNRTCTNGSFGTTNVAYVYNRCAVGTPGACTTQDNYSIPHGSTTPMYTTPSVPFGSTCAKVNRTCSNGGFGTTNGAYVYNRCAIGSAPAPACTLQTEKSIYLPNEQVKFVWTTQNAIGGSLLGTTIPTASLLSGSRTNAIAYGASGTYPVTMTVTGNQATSGQCTANVRVQDVLPPTCTLTVKKSGTTTAGSSVTLGYNDSAILTWTSSNALNYGSSTPSSSWATTTAGVSSGSITITPRERSYTYTFHNAGGSTSCTVNVNYNAPTCTLTASKTKYIYGDSATLTWTSTNADYATATSSNRLVTAGSVTYPNVGEDRNFTFTFTGLGGTQTCSRLIDVDMPMTVIGPNDNSFQIGDLATINWTYPTPPAGTWVYLMLVDTNGNQVGTANIAAQLPTSSGYGWPIPATIGTHTLTTGDYAIRAIAYTPKANCTTSACGAITTIARMDSDYFTINVPIIGALSNAQVAAALSALESILKSMLLQLDFLF